MRNRCPSAIDARWSGPGSAEPLVLGRLHAAELYGTGFQVSYFFAGAGPANTWITCRRSEPLT